MGGVGEGEHVLPWKLFVEVHVRKNTCGYICLTLFLSERLMLPPILYDYKLQFGLSRLRAVQVVKLKEMFDNNIYFMRLIHKK